MIKIGLTGTHGVGKTTAAHGIYYKLKQSNSVFPEHEKNKQDLTIALVSEIARGVNGVINGHSFNTQKMIFHDQFTEEHRASKQAEIVICDRIVLDNLAYMELNYSSNEKYSAWMPHAVGLAVEHIKEYDLIYVLRPNPSYILKDTFGIRFSSLEEQAAVDKVLSRILEENNIQFKEFISVDETVNDVIALNMGEPEEAELDIETKGYMP